MAKIYKILLVDDEESVLRSLERVLRSPSYKVSTAPGGAEALALLEQEPFDLIISDQRMPSMTGIVLLTKVKERFPGMLRVMLSGYSDFDSIIGAINEARVSRFIPKPWDNEELLAIVRSLLEEREADVPKEIVLQLIHSLQTMDRVDLHVKAEGGSVDLEVDFREDGNRDRDAARCKNLVEGCLKGLGPGGEESSRISKVRVTLDTEPLASYAWESRASGADAP